MRNGGAWYDIAQICTSGHIITQWAESHPEYKQNFCERCGKPTITSCPHCNYPIKGYYHSTEGVFSLEEDVLPKFCEDCGKPYPWTESKLKKARNLVNKAKRLKVREKKILIESIDDLVKDTPKKKTAALNFKNLVKKAGSKIAEKLQDLVIEIASETVVKLIKPK